MKERLFVGFLFGIVVGFLGLWSLEVRTLWGSIALVSAFAATFAAIFAFVGKKAIDRIIWFFTHYWP